MGFFRKSGIVFLGIVLFFLLLAGGIILTISLSLEHDNVQTGLKEFLKSAVLINGGSPEEINQTYNEMLIYCKNHTEYVIGDDGGIKQVSVPCSEVVKGQDSIIDYILNSAIDEFYYKNYSCSSLKECVDASKNEGNFPTYLFSEQFKDYLVSKFYIILIFILIFSGLIFLLVEKKINFLYLIGSLLAGISLILIGIEKIFVSFLKSVASEMTSAGISVDKAFNILYNGLSAVFWIYFILGVLMIIVGIVLKVVFYFMEKDNSK